jgi:Transposase DDE domain
MQASPAFSEARRRRQVVEHRIARLVQLGIRQARYFGHAKTLFQLCLAAAVANMTLLAATSNTSSPSPLAAIGWLPLSVVALLASQSIRLAVKPRV